MQNDIKVGDRVKTRFLFHRAIGIVERKRNYLLFTRYLVHYAAVYPWYIGEGHISKFFFQLTKINNPKADAE